MSVGAIRRTSKQAIPQEVHEMTLVPRTSPMRRPIRMIPADARSDAKTDRKDA
jgi:hypothetical protein